VSDSGEAPGFAPSDPTDSRAKLEWVSKYPSDAQKSIRKEAAYLAALLLLSPLGMLLLWLLEPADWLRIPAEKYDVIMRYGVGWLAGMLGGTLFALKWLYHSVARQLWHLDRRLWRLFTPHVSGGVAFVFVALISSGLLRVFDANAANSLSLVVGSSFLVGYFSDSAIAKLSEVADTLFGSNRQRKETRHRLPED
jgi:hypothetical protein